MTHVIDLSAPADQVKRLLDGVSQPQLGWRTPCPDYTVGDLLDHFMGLSLAFAYAAAKSPVPAPGGDDAQAATGPAEVSAANLPADWRPVLCERLDALVAAWRNSAAWEGEATAGGVTLPAAAMGQVVVDELVLHGWDLARATDQPFTCDPDSLRAVLAFTEAMSVPGEEAGREGLFGPVVGVSPDASDFERALGYSGRDPAWSS